MGKLTEYYAILTDKKLPSKDFLYFADFGEKEMTARRENRKLKNARIKEEKIALRSATTDLDKQ
jgi:hypothetical protein